MIYAQKSIPIEYKANGIKDALEELGIPHEKFDAYVKASCAKVGFKSRVVYSHGKVVYC